MAGIIDEQERWIAGKTHLVEIGDIPARGPQTRMAFDMIMRLEQEASSAGGKLHALIGNHDAGVIYGDLRNTLPEEYGEFRTADSEAKLQKALNDELERRRRSGELSLGLPIWRSSRSYGFRSIRPDSLNTARRSPLPVIMVPGSGATTR